MSKSILKAKDEIMSDLQTVLFVLLSELDRIYGSDSVVALVDRKSEKVIMRFPYGMHEDAKKLDIRDMPVTDFMCKLYDYAAEGTLDRMLLDSWEIVDEDIHGFFHGLKDFPLLTNNADDFPLDSCLQVLEVANARRCLDFSGFVQGENEGIAAGYLLLKEVALLAGIDEKTARNLAHPKANNRIVTTKWEGRTMVKIDFARTWLAARGFKETVEVDSELERDLTKRGFWNSAALGDYVRKHRERLGLSKEMLASEANLGNNGVTWLDSLERGDGVFDREFFLELAGVFGIDGRSFLVAALKVIQERELKKLEAELNSLDKAIDAELNKLEKGMEE